METESERYLKWLKHEAIPKGHKNIKYYEQLADTIRADIFNSEEQLCAAKAMNAMGGNIDIRHATKLRAQMDVKLSETLANIEAHKNSLKKLYKQQGEKERRCFEDEVDAVKLGKTPCTNNSRTLLFPQDSLKRGCQQPNEISQPRSLEQATTELGRHPLLQNLEPAPRHSVPIQTAHPDTVTLYEAQGHPGSTGTELEGYTVYTDTTTGTSYAAVEQTGPAPQIVDRYNGPAY